jgi:hypothetical protein
MLVKRIRRNGKEFEKVEIFVEFLGKQFLNGSSRAGKMSEAS